MKIVSIQKVIKVGSSLAVTIPAGDARYYNIAAGDKLEVTLTRPLKISNKDAEIVEMAQKILRRYKDRK